MDTLLNFNATQEYINDLLLNNNTISYYNPPSNDTFGNNLSVSIRFMLSVFYSYMLAVFFWQPLTIFIKTIFQLKKYQKNKEDDIHEGKVFYDDNIFVNLTNLASNSNNNNNNNNNN